MSTQSGPRGVVSVLALEKVIVLSPVKWHNYGGLVKTKQKKVLFVNIAVFLTRLCILRIVAELSSTSSHTEQHYMPSMCLSLWQRLFIFFVMMFH